MLIPGSPAYLVYVNGGMGLERISCIILFSSGLWICLYAFLDCDCCVIIAARLLRYLLALLSLSCPLNRCTQAESQIARTMFQNQRQSAGRLAQMMLACTSIMDHMPVSTLVPVAKESAPSMSVACVIQCRWLTRQVQRSPVANEVFKPDYTRHGGTIAFCERRSVSNAWASFTSALDRTNKQIPGRKAYKNANPKSNATLSFFWMVICMRNRCGRGRMIMNISSVMVSAPAV